MITKDFESHSVESVEVSAIVPTRNSERTLEACLKSLKSQQYPCTLIVVENNSNDRTFDIAGQLADIVLTGGPERSAQRNLGASATTASVVGFIDSDMALSAEVVSEVVKAIQSGSVSVVVPERTIASGFWAAVRAFERDLNQGSDANGGPTLFVRITFNNVHGFDEEMTGPEDWDLGLRVGTLGEQTRIEAWINHVEGHLRYLEAYRKKAYYTPGIRLFLRKYKKVVG